MITIERFKYLWEKPLNYVLGPIPDRVITETYFGNAVYAPYQRNALDYMCILLPKDIAQAIIDKMISSGVTILNNIPLETVEEKADHLWTDKVNEFALITNPYIEPPYSIFHKELLTLLILRVYLIVLEKMLFIK